MTHRDHVVCNPTSVAKLDEVVRLLDLPLKPCVLDIAVGGVVEDPATGAAAAAFGGYLRARGEIRPPATFEIVQGVEMGRPSRLTVSIEPGEDGVRVSGNAVPI